MRNEREQRKARSSALNHSTTPFHVAGAVQEVGADHRRKRRRRFCGVAS
jgi:hypothetical protein